MAKTVQKIAMTTTVKKSFISELSSRCFIWPFLFCIRIENFEGAHTGQAFLEISNGRKTVRMALILTIIGPNESQRCQLNFEKNWAVEKISARAKNSKKFVKSSKNFTPYTVFGTKQNRNIQIDRAVAIQSVRKLSKSRLPGDFSVV